jgi:hypothetical protein
MECGGGNPHNSFFGKPEGIYPKLGFEDNFIICFIKTKCNYVD